MQRAMSRYIKRKKLEPLDAYVPSVLLSRRQLTDVREALVSILDPSQAADVPATSAEPADGSEPSGVGLSDQLEAIRAFLRSGPLGSLRTDLRAIAKYAAEGSAAGSATGLVANAVTGNLTAQRFDFQGDQESGKAASVGAESCLQGLVAFDIAVRQASAGQAEADREKIIAELDSCIAAMDAVLASVPVPVRLRSEEIVKSYDAQMGRMAGTGTSEGTETATGDGESEGESEGEKGSNISVKKGKQSDIELLEKIL